VKRGIRICIKDIAYPQHVVRLNLYKLNKIFICKKCNSGQEPGEEAGRGRALDEELEKAQALWVRYQAIEAKMLYFCSAKAKLSEI
jgi:hypothetical protein